MTDENDFYAASVEPLRNAPKWRYERVDPRIPKMYLKRICCTK